MTKQNFQELREHAMRMELTVELLSRVVEKLAEAFSVELREMIVTDGVGNQISVRALINGARLDRCLLPERFTAGTLVRH